jgi:hypothetical protein
MTATDPKQTADTGNYVTNIPRFLAQASIALACTFFAYAAVQADVRTRVIDKQVDGCEIALEHYREIEGGRQSFSPSSLTEEEKTYSTLCAGIVKSVLTSLGAYGRTELKLEGVCLPESMEDVHLVDLLPVVLVKMKSRLGETDSYEYYDAIFLATTATIDAVSTLYDCERMEADD